jgi:hypothetical protein
MNWSFSLNKNNSLLVIEHSEALARVYVNKRDTLREEFRKRSLKRITLFFLSQEIQQHIDWRMQLAFLFFVFQVPRLESVEWRVDYLISSNVLQVRTSLNFNISFLSELSLFVQFSLGFLCELWIVNCVVLCCCCSGITNSKCSVAIANDVLWEPFSTRNHYSLVWNQCWQVPRSFKWYSLSQILVLRVISLSLSLWRVRILTHVWCVLIYHIIWHPQNWKSPKIWWTVFKRVKTKLIPVTFKINDR